MRDHFRSARTPGPLGRLPQAPAASGTHHIGPLGVYLAPAPVAQAVVNRFVLPALETIVSGHKTKNINNVDWPLFDRKSKQPQTRDVQQGAIWNCPLASILTALATTGNGRKLIKNMVSEVTGVTTETKYVGADGIEGRKTVPGTRYFTVTFLGGRSVQVSDVFYTDESTPPNPIYMTSPADVLWPCVIEKAYAKLEGGYNKLGNDPIAVWKDIVGTPKFMDLRAAADPAVEDRAVVAQAKRATSTPMIAARTASWHGVAVLGANKGSDPRQANKRTDMIQMYDQNKVKEVTESIHTLRAIDPTLLIYGDP